ncbi:MAG: tRNA lysidine(34) synthetase TilS [Muribaculaceae bacterium]|nr:tRNA lysidine(34) synthetase TilS [Muribaculaceae bacterium]
MNFQYYKRHALEKVVSGAIKSAQATKFIVAISGGADSIALLASLASARHTQLLAAHCNFHLRGEESIRDQQFVEKICSDLGIRLLVHNFDVPEYQRQNPSTSLEMACRDLRYEWFRQLLSEYNYDRIATGHNADDNIETMLLNLLRGSGTTGLRAMLPDTGTVIRPLLTLHRNEIEAYLKTKGLDYIVDSSNLTSDFRRNFLRNDILPMLRQRWHGLNKALDRSIKLIKAENEVVEKAVADALPKDGTPLLSTTALSFPAPELLIRRYIHPLQPLTTTAEEIVAAMRAEKSDIRRWHLPGGTVTLRGQKLFLTQKN